MILYYLPPWVPGGVTEGKGCILKYDIFLVTC